MSTLVSRRKLGGVPSDIDIIGVAGVIAETKHFDSIPLGPRSDSFEDPPPVLPSEIFPPARASIVNIAPPPQSPYLSRDLYPLPEYVRGPPPKHPPFMQLPGFFDLFNVISSNPRKVGPTNTPPYKTHL